MFSHNLFPQKTSYKVTTLQPVLSRERVWLWAAEMYRLMRRALSNETPDEETETVEVPEHQAADPDPSKDLQGLRDLDPEIISQVHNKYFPAVYRYARYRLGNGDLAEDVTSEAFTRLLEHTHKGRGPRSNVRGWLMRTVSNLINDHFRAVYARPTGEMPENLAEDAPGPVSLFESSVEKGELIEAMKLLTEEQAHVLALRFGSELSLAETARVMGKKANAIKALQFRAIAALRRHMTRGAEQK